MFWDFGQEDFNSVLMLYHISLSINHVLLVCGIHVAMRFRLDGYKRYKYSASIICLVVGFDVTKYENIPHSDNGIQKSVSGKYFERFSSVGSDVCIFGVLFNLILASIIK